MLILGWISEGIIGAGLWIVSGIYHVAAFVFELFLILATGQLVDASSYETIITNVYIILGIVMLFALAFSLLRGMVNPDDQKQGASYVKKVIINLITSTIIMAVLPTIFTFAYDFQDAIITEQNTIGKFFGYGGSGSNDTPTASSNLDKVKQGAYQIVNGVWTAFFNINSDYCAEFLKDEGEDPSSMTSKEQITYCQENIIADESASIDGMSGDYSFDDSSTWVDQSGSFGVYGSFAGNIDDNELDFNFLLAMIGGIILIFVGVSYCFDMAVRLVKLVFLQLIAPLPIFFRIIPDNSLGKSFGNWTKMTLACYLEVYIRIIVFYFVIYLCNEMMKSNFLGNEIYEYGWFLAFLAKAFVLIGLITFMRSAPKLFSEVTGIDSGNMKLGIREKLAAGGVFTAGAIAGGALTTGVRNLTNAGQNVKNKYKENRDAGKGKFKSALGATGTAFRGLGSVVGGTVSGGVRSGKSGLGAKSFSDMKNSASKGANDAVEAREYRATYRSRHGDNVFGVALGHAKDAIDSVGRWAGLDNVNVLLAQQKTINSLQSERKAIDSESFDVIDGDLAKGKGSVSYDSTSAAHLGVTHDMVNLRRLKAELDAAKASGVAADIATAEVAYSKYRADWADELRNIALKGEANWASIGKDVQADLAKVRIATDKYRESVARNYTASYVNTLTDAADILDKNKDLSVTHSTLKDIKDEMKIAETQITNQINKIRQKEQDKKGK